MNIQVEILNKEKTSHYKSLLRGLANSYYQDPFLPFVVFVNLNHEDYEEIKGNGDLRVIESSPAYFMD